MSDVMDIIGNLDVVEEIEFPDEIVLKLYQDRLKERKQGYFLSYIKGQVEITCIAELTLQIKGKIMDIAPAYIMGVMMSMPSSLAIESAAKYVKDKYGFETKNVEGEIFPSITLTDEIIAGLMNEYPELAEMVRAHVESKVSVVSGRKLLNRGALEPARAIPINLEQSGIEIYNELRLAKLSGAERAVLLAEMQSITNSGVLLYALKRHHHDVE